jgi:hypothetical protein
MERGKKGKFITQAVYLLLLCWKWKGNRIAREINAAAVMKQASTAP